VSETRARAAASRAYAQCAATLSFALPGAAPASAQEQPAISHGLSYMTAFGPKNYPVVSLLYGIMAISLAVIVVVGLLVLIGALVKGRNPAAIGDVASVPVERGASGLPFVYIALTITILILFATAIWNYVVLADIAQVPRDTAVNIRVIGHQWWWEFSYAENGSLRGFTTANEFHIPVGEPVRFEVTTADVIHSFWVPALSGKTDTIPGQRNVTWMQADRAGIYRGQCTEYCGQQHAHMGILVTADAPKDFQHWWNHQLEGPRTPTSAGDASAAEAGEATFMRRCAVCHTIRGTLAQGKVGPDLSHLMQRKTLGAVAVPNSIGDLSGWISDPQHIKPGNLMPDLDLSAAELNSLRSYLHTLN
jgi:cytochrome c oxidase subunit II